METLQKVGPPPPPQHTHTHNSQHLHKPYLDIRSFLLGIYEPRFFNLWHCRLRLWWQEIEDLENELSEKV